MCGGGGGGGGGGRGGLKFEVEKIPQEPTESEPKARLKHQREI